MKFMDVHTGMKGITPEALLEAHNADLAIQGEEGVQVYPVPVEA